MSFHSNIRKLDIIEVYENNTLIGKFANMSLVNHILKNKLKLNLIYRFVKIEEKKDRDFYRILKKGYVMKGKKKMNLTKEQKDMLLSLDLSNPDVVVGFLLDFYEKHGIDVVLNSKTESKLLAELSKYKPLKTAIELQQKERQNG